MATCRLALASTCGRTAYERKFRAARDIVSTRFIECNAVLSGQSNLELKWIPVDRPVGAVNGLEGAIGSLVRYTDINVRAGAKVLIQNAPDGHVDDRREAGSLLQSGAVVISSLPGHAGGDVVVAVVVQGQPSRRTGATGEA